MDIVRKSHDHKDAVDNGDDIYSQSADIGQKDHDDQTGKQNRGADLTGDQCACEHTALSVGDQTGEELEAFLDDKENDQMEQNGKLDAQAQNQGELRYLVSDGIQYLTNGGGHVEFPGDFAVYKVSQAGDCQNNSRADVIPGLGGVQIDSHIDGDQQQTE